MPVETSGETASGGGAGARAAVFDLDGTLADTAPDLIGAANDLLVEQGLAALDPTTARNTAGRGGKALISLGHERAGHPLDSSAVEDLFPRYLQLYEARIDAESRLFPGVEAALDRLEAEGWRLGVCTNKPERLARLLLDRLGLLHRFAALLGADTLPVKKPDPRHLLETIARLGAAPERSVLIGDSQTDRDAARNAEVKIVLVSFGYALSPPASLKPDALIDGFAELHGALNGLSL